MDPAQQRAIGQKCARSRRGDAAGSICRLLMTGHLTERDQRNLGVACSRLAKGAVLAIEICLRALGYHGPVGYGMEHRLLLERIAREGEISTIISSQAATGK